jgi:hypothetical protein
MPLTIPAIDDRKYQQLLDEALARVPIHNPEWTNFNKSDPGVTLIELFAFLTESLLYRANQVPERNRRKFLQLLGVGLQPATAAQGLITFRNERGAARTLTLAGGVEVRAGPIPFRTERGLDVLPLEAAAYYKRSVAPDERTTAYYEELYASFTATDVENPDPATLKFYETTPFSPRGTEPVDLSTETIDGSLWLALMVRPVDLADPNAVERAREDIKGKTLSLGLVPAAGEQGRRVAPGEQPGAEARAVLQFQLPSLPPGGALSEVEAERNARYRVLSSVELPEQPVVVDVPLPSTVEELRLWTNLNPLEAGTRDFPPALANEEQERRIVTWLRITGVSGSQARLLWTGINTASVTQRSDVVNELLPAGTGEPDQVVKLAKTPVLPGTVRITVTSGTQSEAWEQIDDLMAAGPEVAVPDPRLPPGAPVVRNPRVKVFTVDPESGEVRFGDGLHGARPPLGATLRADYAYGVGKAGNLGPGAITSGPALPPGIQVVNPLPTWGGADAETVREGEKQIARHLQHRERLVTVRDFETLTLRTPGVSVGRVDVLPAFHPTLSPNEPGDSPGSVTVMVLPRFDPDPPKEAGPDTFTDTIACWLAPRRLVTTELFVRRPQYVPIWVSVGLDVVAGVSTAVVREAVKQALSDFLSPLPPPDVEPLAEQESLLSTPQYSAVRKGWPLRKAVVALELAAVASRVSGVSFVKQVRLGLGEGAAQEQVPMTGLQLPRLAGIVVAVGDAPTLDELRGTAPDTGTGGSGGNGGQGPVVVPVPIVPEEC